MPEVRKANTEFFGEWPKKKREGKRKTKKREAKRQQSVHENTEIELSGEFLLEGADLLLDN